LRGAALALLAATSANAADRTFQAEGVDTGAGIGPRWVAQAGAGVAAADDLYAIYTNPAGLLGVRGLEVSISRQLNARLLAGRAAEDRRRRLRPCRDEHARTSSVPPPT
jgi:hypothetical protein